MKNLIRLTLVVAAFILSPFVHNLHFDCLETLCESQFGELINQLSGIAYFIVTESLVRFHFGPFCFLLGVAGGFTHRRSNEELLIWIPIGLLLHSVYTWTTADVAWDSHRITGFVTETLSDMSAIPMMLIGFRVSKLALAPRMLRWRIRSLLLITLAISLILASSLSGRTSYFGFSVGVLSLSAVLAMMLNQRSPVCREDEEIG